MRMLSNYLDAGLFPTAIATRLGFDPKAATPCFTFRRLTLMSDQDQGLPGHLGQYFRSQQLALEHGGQAAHPCHPAHTQHL